MPSTPHTSSVPSIVIIILSSVGIALTPRSWVTNNNKNNNNNNSEDRCLEKHSHGDVAHAVGLPLGLHIIMLDARSREASWKALACEVKEASGGRRSRLGRHTLAEELLMRAADGDRPCWTGGRPLTPRPQERTAFAARRSKLVHLIHNIYIEIAAGALPFLGGPPTCGIQVLATGLDRRYEAVRGQWRLGHASRGYQNHASFLCLYH